MRRRQALASSPRVLLRTALWAAFPALALLTAATTASLATPDSEPDSLRRSRVILDIGEVAVTRGRLTLSLDLTRLPFDAPRAAGKEAAVTMSTFGSNRAPGEPDLPERDLRLALPAGTREGPVRLSLERAEWRDLGRGHRVRSAVPLERAAAPSARTDGGGIRPDWDARNHGKDAFFPAEPVELSGQSRRGPERFVWVRLRPFRYNPATGALQKLERATCVIEYDEEPSSSEGTPSSQDPLRGDGATSFAGAASQRSGYAIITTNAIAGGSARLADFIQAKRDSGREVYLVTESQYGALAGAPPHGTAEKIRQWLIDNYLALGISQVLLIGNPDPDDPTDPLDSVGDVPMKMLYPRAGTTYYWNDYESPSDLYYADLTGNWNLDGDELFGEYAPSGGAVTPDPRILPNTYSIRWTGRVEITDPAGGRLGAFYDDGMRMWIDDLSGPPAIDDWRDHLAGSGFRDVGPGLHDIRIEYFQDQSNACFWLLQGPRGASWFGLVAPDKLYHWDGQQYVAGGLRAEYFNDENLTEPVFTRVDPDSTKYSLNYTWMTGDNDVGGVDFVPEVTVGRIPVYGGDGAQLDRILDKMLRYEYSVDTLWRRAVLLPMKPLDDDTPCYQIGEQIRQQLCEPAGFRTFRVYEQDYGCSPPPESMPCTVENVLAAWQAPFGLVNWATHGSSGGAASVMDSYNCNGLQDARPAFVYQGSCNNGYPEDWNNLGYALLKNGAIGTVSASRVSWYSIGISSVNPGDRTIHGIGYFFTQNLLAGMSAGEALSQVRVVSPSSSDMHWMNSFDFNLYGDPAAGLGWSGRRDRSPPSAPSLLAPAQGLWTNLVTPAFAWTAASDWLSGVAYYAMQFATEESFADPRSIVTTDTSFVPTDPLPEDSIYWHVRAVDAAGNHGDWSATRSLVIDTSAPGTVALLDPVGDRWLPGRTVSLSWSAVAAAKAARPTAGASSAAALPDRAGGAPIRYVVQWGRTRLTGDTGAGDTVSSCRLPVDLAEGRFFWRVRALDLAGNQGAWTASDSFRVDLSAPGAPLPLWPAAGASTSDGAISLLWRSSTDPESGVDHYVLQLSQDPGYANSMEVVLADTTWATGAPLSDGVWHWRVRSVNHVAQESGWSADRSFELDTQAPLAPSLTDPDDGSWLARTTVGLCWSAARAPTRGGTARRPAPPAASPDAIAQSAVRYAVQVAAEPTFASPALLDTVAACSLQVTPGEGIHYWRVKAFDVAGNEADWTAGRRFGVDCIAPSAASPLGPASGTCVDSSFTLTWRPASDAGSGLAEYVVEYGRSPLLSDACRIACADTCRVLSGLAPGLWYWRVRAADAAGNLGPGPPLPWSLRIVGRDFSGLLLTPNPGAQGSVQLVYRLRESAAVRLDVFDVSGRRMFWRESQEDPGVHAFAWDGRDMSGGRVAPGIFVYRLQTGGRTAVTRGVWLR